MCFGVLCSANRDQPTETPAVIVIADADQVLPLVVKAEHDPRERFYWEGMLQRDEARLTHRIKTLYGFYTLRRFIEDEATRKKAEDAFLYLMA